MRVEIFEHYIRLNNTNYFDNELIEYIQSLAGEYSLDLYYLEKSKFIETIQIEGENDKLYLFLIHLSWTIHCILE